jgi:hypothetical protein
MYFLICFVGVCKGSRYEVHSASMTLLDCSKENMNTVWVHKHRLSASNWGTYSIHAAVNQNSSAPWGTVWLTDRSTMLLAGRWTRSVVRIGRLRGKSMDYLLGQHWVGLWIYSPRHSRSLCNSEVGEFIFPLGSAHVDFFSLGSAHVDFFSPPDIILNFHLTLAFIKKDNVFQLHNRIDTDSSHVICCIRFQLFTLTYILQIMLSNVWQCTIVYHHWIEEENWFRIGWSVLRIRDPPRRSLFKFWILDL